MTSSVISTLPKVDLVRDLCASLDSEMRHAVFGERAAGIADKLSFKNTAQLQTALEATRSLFVDAEDFERAARAIATDMFLRSIVHAELTLDLLASPTPVAAQLDAFEAGFEAVVDEHPDAFLSWGLIVEIRRGGDCAVMQAALDEAVESSRRVLAIELVGPETPLTDAECTLIAHARELGLRLVISAGMQSGGRALKDAVELKADRVVHGIGVLKNPHILTHLRAHRVPFLCTATIEVRTGRARSYARHPLPLMLEAGLLATFASGAAGLWDGSLTDEFDQLSVNLGWRLDQLRNSTLRAVEAAFIEPKLRFTVARAVENWRHRPRLSAGGDDEGFGM